MTNPPPRRRSTRVTTTPAGVGHALESLFRSKPLKPAPFVQVRLAVVDDDTLTSTDLALFTLLEREARGSGVVDRTNAYLAERLQTSLRGSVRACVRTVQRSMAVLEDRGWVTRRPQFVHGERSGTTRTTHQIWNRVRLVGAARTLWRRATAAEAQAREAKALAAARAQGAADALSTTRHRPSHATGMTSVSRQGQSIDRPREPRPDGWCPDGPPGMVLARSCLFCRTGRPHPVS